MKVLLISDVPPCDDFTAGLALAAMVRLLPRGSICCFAVVNRRAALRMSPEFSGIPVEFHPKPLENWTWVPRKFPMEMLGSLATMAAETYTCKKLVKSLTAKAVEFGRKQKVDRVWAVLQGQTNIRMALAVADGLNVQLHSHVWDPFSWWVKANKIDVWTSRKTQNLFDETISRSVMVATASHAMAKEYGDRFGVRALPVISGHSRKIACSASTLAGVGGTISIGMAGQFYASDEWLQLIRTLDGTNWTVTGRRVRIVAMGPTDPPSAPSNNVTFLGWKSQNEAIEILSRCDFLYCPYPFDPSMKEVAQLSFPSKLVIYLAAGRPVIFHGPVYSAPAQYIADKGCGVLVTELAGDSILHEIERLAGDAKLYARIASMAQKAFLEDFTLEAMARSFNDFICQSVQSDDATTIHDHAAHAGDEPQPDHLPQPLYLSLESSFRGFVRRVKKAFNLA